MNKEEKCPVCKGSGIIVDRVHTWKKFKCFACDGTGIEGEWHKKIRLSGETANEK